MKTFDYLLAHNIKPSVQRLAIMDYLLSHRIHPSVDTIYLALAKKYPTLSRTTVYNTLKLFVENGAAQMLTIDEKNVNFDSDLSLHSHFLCKECGRIFDLPYHGDKKNMDEPIMMNGYKIEEVYQYYKGICPECEKKIKN